MQASAVAGQGNEGDGGGLGYGKGGERANRLILEKSPYLLQHAHNPVSMLLAAERATRHPVPISCFLVLERAVRWDLACWAEL